MSVLIVDLGVYNYVRAGVSLMAEVAVTNSTNNVLFSPAAANHFKGKNFTEEAERLVKSWINLNERSYDLTYNETPDEVPLSEFLEIKPVKIITSLQLLKYLFAIRYNIEPESHAGLTQETQDIEVLSNLINDLRVAYVSSMDEWASTSVGDITDNATLVPFFDYVNRGLLKIAFNRTCDDFYSYRGSSYLNYGGADPEVESKKLTSAWANLVMVNPDSKGTHPISSIYDSPTHQKPPLSPTRFVKYLTCILAAIGESNKLNQESKAVTNLLNDIIVDIMNSIITYVPEYKTAKFSTL